MESGMGGSWGTEGNAGLTGTRTRVYVVAVL